MNTGTIPHFDTEKKLDIWDKTCILHQKKLNLVEHYVRKSKILKFMSEIRRKVENAYKVYNSVEEIV